MKDFEETIEGALKDNKKENYKNNKNELFDYEKKAIYGTIDISKNWQIQVTKTSWKGRKAKYEIRKWKKDGTPSKGVTCTEEQFKQLIEILGEIEI